MPPPRVGQTGHTTAPSCPWEENQRALLTPVAGPSLCPRTSSPLPVDAPPPTREVLGSRADLAPVPAWCSVTVSQSWGLSDPLRPRPENGGGAGGMGGGARLLSRWGTCDVIFTGTLLHNELVGCKVKTLPRGPQSRGLLRRRRGILKPPRVRVPQLQDRCPGTSGAPSRKDSVAVLGDSARAVNLSSSLENVAEARRTRPPSEGSHSRETCRTGDPQRRKAFEGLGRLFLWS